MHKTGCNGILWCQGQNQEDTQYSQEIIFDKINRLMRGVPGDREHQDMPKQGCDGILWCQGQNQGDTQHAQEMYATRSDTTETHHETM